ncbi:MAG: hypothetical protein SH850_03730 [Planctomycetaceae bacterium]|nr:hypothetical protein [Planctomycetaceae bacterium]
MAKKMVNGWLLQAQQEPRTDDPGRSHRCRFEIIVSCSGGANEWHLDCAKSFEDFTFGFVPWFHQAVVVLGSSFGLSWLESIRPIGDAVSGDGLQQVLINHFPLSRAALFSMCNQR